MSNNKEFFELYTQTRLNHNKLHHWELDNLTVGVVKGRGRRRDVDILSCHHFGVITTEGCVVVTHDHGVWLKVNSEQWFNPVTNQSVLRHDLDIVRLLIIEADKGKVATIIDPDQ